MSQPRVTVCLFSPLGAALVLGPADPPEDLGHPGSPYRVPWREATQDQRRRGAERDAELPGRNAASRGS